MSRLTTFVLRIIVSVCAFALVSASAGFSSVYAYRIGIEHSLLLAILTVLMALALEGIKPLAIASAFKAFASVHLIKGLVLAALGMVAVVYSLTSELALVSMTRGDLVAKRQATINHSIGANDSYKRAPKELSRLKPSRPVGELEAAISAIQNLPGIMIEGRPCGGVYNGPVTQTNCPKLHALKAELARSDRRTKLQAILNAHVELSHSKHESSVKVADPGSTALVTYLGALGIVVSIEVVSQWLNLVPVLALEMGSALALVLVQAVGTLDLLGGSIPVVQDQAVQKSTPRKGGSPNKSAVEAKIIRHIYSNGGHLHVSERALAKALGSTKPTIRRAIQSIFSNGTILTTTSKNGTKILLN